MLALQLHTATTQWQVHATLASYFAGHPVVMIERSQPIAHRPEP